MPQEPTHFLFGSRGDTFRHSGLDLVSALGAGGQVAQEMMVVEPALLLQDQLASRVGWQLHPPPGRAPPAPAPGAASNPLGTPRAPQPGAWFPRAELSP